MLMPAPRIVPNHPSFCDFCSSRPDLRTICRLFSLLPDPGVVADPRRRVDPHHGRQRVPHGPLQLLALRRVSGIEKVRSPRREPVLHPLLREQLRQQL